jgi:hypothetical protein
VIAAIDSAGRGISQIISWALTAGNNVLSTASEVLMRAGHTIEDVLLWVEKSALSGLRAAIRGLIAAGATMTTLMSWAATRTVQVIRDVVTELIAVGITLTQLVADMVSRPSNAMRNLIQALGELGRTLRDIVEAAVVQPTEEAVRRVFQALRDLGRNALDVLKAAAEVGGAALALAFTLILEWFPGSYRPLTATEHAEAEKVFGTSIQLSDVRVAVLSLPVDLIEWVNGGRAFTTMHLINFASWTHVTMEVLIHELTHVWQAMVAGPVYMVEALEAQATSENYNYGYTDSHNGEGAQEELDNAGGDFSQFNREQQAQIIEHYYVRRYLQSVDYSAWSPYADVVHT